MRDGNGSRCERDLVRLAARQHGVVSLQQLRGIGYSRSDVSRRARGARLERVLPGVYRIGGAPPSPEQLARAATLWAGPDAVASHDTAAALWRMAGPERAQHVSTQRRLTSPPRGVRTHLAALPKRDRGTLRGVPVTSPARTLLDVAAYRTDELLLPLVERAVLERLVDAEQISDVLRRNPGRRGSRRLAATLDLAGSSVLERRVAALLRSADLPPHVREHAVGRWRLDFAWPAQRVALEADGRRWHSSAPDFERDRAKSNDLNERGWRVLRVTWRSLDDPGPLLSALERCLRP